MEFANSLIKLALAEDIGRGDITTNTLIPAHQQARGLIIAKQPGVICGLPLIKQVYQHLSKDIRVTLKAKEGALVRSGQVLAVIIGPARPILTGERTVLNFLQRLSGIATLTRRYVQSVKPYKVKILDTRKTVPGWRALDKYAVRTGGGTNHRMGLYDGILIKNNHLNLVKLDRLNLRYLRPGRVPVEIEVRNLEEFHAALERQPDIIMLDNLDSKTVKMVVPWRDRLFPQVKLEVSGGLNLKNIRRYAATGIDYISVGALTHSAPALDIALRVNRLPR